MSILITQESGKITQESGTWKRFHVKGGLIKVYYDLEGNISHVETDVAGMDMTTAYNMAVEGELVEKPCATSKHDFYYGKW